MEEPPPDRGPGPGAAPPAPEAAEVAAAVRRIEADLAAVQAALTAADERAAARERVIDRLHEDNQRLRAGERRLLLRPVLVDLYRLRDGLLRQAATLPASLTAAEMSELLVSFAYSVEQALDRCGVRPLRACPGDPVDPGRHRVVGSVAAADPGQDGQVAEALADGYLDLVEERVLAPAAVRVSRWAPPAGERPPPDPGHAAGGQPG